MLKLVHALCMDIVFVASCAILTADDRLSALYIGTGLSPAQACYHPPELWRNGHF